MRMGAWSMACIITMLRVCAILYIFDCSLYSSVDTLGYVIVTVSNHYLITMHVFCIVMVIVYDDPTQSHVRFCNSRVVKYKCDIWNSLTNGHKNRINNFPISCHQSRVVSIKISLFLLSSVYLLFLQLPHSVS